MIASRYCRPLLSSFRPAADVRAKDGSVARLARRLGVAMILSAVLLPLAGCTKPTTRTHLETTYFMRVTHEDGGQTAELFALEIEATLEGESEAVVGYAPSAPFRAKEEEANVEAEEGEDGPDIDTFMVMRDGGDVRMQPLAEHDALVLISTDMVNVIREVGTLDLLASTVANINHSAGPQAQPTSGGMSISAATRDALAERAEIEAMKTSASAELAAAERTAKAAEENAADLEHRVGNLVASLTPGADSATSRSTRREASQLQLQLARQNEAIASERSRVEDLRANLAALDEALAANDALDRLRAEMTGTPMPASTDYDSNRTEESEESAVDATEESTGAAPTLQLTRTEKPAEAPADVPAMAAERAPAPPAGRGVRRIYRYNGELFDGATAPDMFAVSDAAGVRALLSEWGSLLEAAGVGADDVEPAVVEARDGLAAWTEDAAEPVAAVKGSAAEALLRALELAAGADYAANADGGSEEDAPTGDPLLASALLEGAASPDLRAAHDEFVGADRTLLVMVENEGGDERALSPGLIAAALATSLSNGEAWTLRENATRPLTAKTSDGRTGILLTVNRDLQFKQLEPDVLGHLNVWWKSLGSQQFAARAAAPASAASGDATSALIAAELSSDSPSATTILRLLDLSGSVN